ncbi:MAG: DUF1178 family protein, partial [Polaromonas sp.]|nr:DUF1178 family protein [Polaromonas sp.]
AHQHSFEGWFASEDDFQAQLARGLIECPLCADKGIRKMPTAPRLNLGIHPTQDAPGKSGGKPRLAPAFQAEGLGAVPRDAGSGLSAGALASDQAALLKALRQVVADTEDVGDRFTQEVRRMHYGDSAARSIRGQASLKDAVELLEEGIDVLPLPPSLKETLQ